MGARNVFEVERTMINAKWGSPEAPVIPAWPDLPPAHRMLLIAMYYAGAAEGMNALSVAVKAAREAGPNG